MNQQAPLPWKRLMAFGLGALKLSPQAFWAMSLPELDAALRWHFGDADNAMTAHDLESLMRRFPDQRKDVS